MLIGVLVVVALALLVSAFLTGTTVLAGAALVVSLAAAVLYVIALRRDPDGADGPPAPVAASEKAPDEKVPAEKAPETKTAVAAKAAPIVGTTPGTKAPETKTAVAAKAEPVVAKTPGTKAPETKTAVATKAAPAVAATPATPAATELAGTTVVHVVPGRMRYHVQGCQVIDGQQVEDLTVDDARDEGFTACSRCAARGRSHATA